MFRYTIEAPAVMFRSFNRKLDLLTKVPILQKNIKNQGTTNTETVIRFSSQINALFKQKA